MNLQELDTITATLDTVEQTIINNNNLLSISNDDCFIDINTTKYEEDVSKNLIKLKKYNFTSLNDLHDYLIMHKVFFGSIYVINMHALLAYDIKLCVYNLKIKNFDINKFNKVNFFSNTFDKCINVSELVIDEVSPGSTDEEKYLYGYVVEFMKSYLPIKFEETGDEYDLNSILEMKIKIKECKIKLKDGIVSLPIYYLLKNTRTNKYFA